jgi:hypothetical protein
MTTATLNDQYPGATPPGTEVEVLSESGPSVFIRVGRKTVKASPKWLDRKRPRLVPRRLRVREGMWG